MGFRPIPSFLNSDVFSNPAFKDGGFYAEAPFAISTAAFEALRKGDETAFSEMFRSCLVQSAERGCEEHTAMSELFHMNENGFIAGARKSVAEMIDSKQLGLLRTGRFATAYYREPETGEPVFIQWLQIDLNPLNGGVRKPKKAAEKEKVRDWNWEGDLKPVPAYVPARTSK